MNREEILRQELPQPEGDGRELVARICKIGRHDYLIADCYAGETKVARIALTQKDYIVYDVREDRWRRRSLYDIWTVGGWSLGRTLGECDADEQTEEAVRRYTGERQKAGVAIKSAINDRRVEKEAKREEKREQKRDEDIESTPELPEDFEDWAKQSIKDAHMLLYKRDKRKTQIWCGACGQESTIYKRDERDFMIPERKAPKAGEIALCPSCRALGKYCHEGRKREETKIRYVYIIQKTCMDDIVIRMFKVQRRERKSEKEEIRIYEEMREFIGKKGARKYFQWSGGWERGYPGGWGNPVKLENGKIYPGYIGVIRSTQLFKYCDVQQWKELRIWKGDPEIRKVVDLLKAYRRTPQLEFLIKCGFTKLATRLISGISGWENKNGKKPEDFLQIRKERVKALGDIGTDELRILQMEKRMNMIFMDHDIERMKQINKAYGWERHVEQLLQYMTITKMLNRIDQYKKEYGSKEEALREYADYIGIREELGYDMTNSAYLHPNILREKHREMIRERIIKGQGNGFIATKNKEFANIAKKYKKLEKKYGYKKDGYCIRPAKDAGEIIMEGRILHHCVGGDNYLKKHNDGKSTILFLRDEEKPDEPYITIEISGTVVLQWFGIHDTKPDQMHMQQYIDKYVKQLDERRKNHANRDSGELQRIQAAV